jgi:hypothetical protein
VAWNPTAVDTAAGENGCREAWEKTTVSYEAAKSTAISGNLRQMEGGTKMRAKVAIGAYIILTLAAATSANGADKIVLFADNFNCCVLKHTWVASLPDAYWRYQSRPNGIAEFIGPPSYLFESLDGASVIRLTNTLNNAQRVGLSTRKAFDSQQPIKYKVRFNTLDISSRTTIDQMIEIWLIDADHIDRFDEVALSAPGYGSQRVFTAYSSISDTGVDTGQISSRFTFSSNTWYRLSLEGSPQQDVTAILCDDSERRVVMRFDFGHTMQSYPTGFRIGVSQSMGLPGAPYPTDVAIDWVRLTSGD